jgi:hypothetical protein
MRNLALLTGLLSYAFVLGWAMRGYYQPAYNSARGISDAPDSLVAVQTGSVEVSRKYKFKRSFIDYPISARYDGNSSVQLDFASCQYGKQYEELLKKTAESGANFAGHFAFTEIRTEENGLVSIVVDLKTGRVYMGPDANKGYQFYLGSRMLMINPPDSHGWYSPCDSCLPEQYLWTGKYFKKL